MKVFLRGCNKFFLIEFKYLKTSNRLMALQKFCKQTADLNKNKISFAVKLVIIGLSTRLSLKMDINNNNLEATVSNHLNFDHSLHQPPTQQTAAKQTQKQTKTSTMASSSSGNFFTQLLKQQTSSKSKTALSMEPSKEMRAQWSFSLKCHLLLSRVRRAYFLRSCI